MQPEDAIATLRQNKKDLRARGILHAVLFGSTARGDSTAASDIDLAVTFVPGSKITLFDIVGLEKYIARLMERRVDLVKLPVRRTALRAAIEQEGIDAF